MQSLVAAITKHQHALDPSLTSAQPGTLLSFNEYGAQILARVTTNKYGNPSASVWGIGGQPLIVCTEVANDKNKSTTVCGFCQKQQSTSERPSLVWHDHAFLEWRAKKVSCMTLEVTVDLGCSIVATVKSRI